MIVMCLLKFVKTVSRQALYCRKNMQCLFCNKRNLPSCSQSALECTLRCANAAQFTFWHSNVCRDDRTPELAQECTVAKEDGRSQAPGRSQVEDVAPARHVAPLKER